ncbi:epithelial membrane protein 1-like [Clytia hemisphaerica]|uniref:Uncharacterized protein n=1 Tax=Clytia hemisphaerica TaxID=252671 RepID=A0A7M5USU2_9CNID
MGAISKSHLNVFNITVGVALTILILSCIAGNSWLINKRLQSFSGIWRRCYETSNEQGTICVPYEARDTKEKLLRTFLILAALSAALCIGFSVLAIYVKYINHIHVYFIMFLTFICLICSVPLKTQQIILEMEAKKDDNYYAFGWAFYVSWISVFLALVFGICGLVGLRYLEGPEENFEEQTDELIFERF